MSSCPQHYSSPASRAAQFGRFGDTSPQAHLARPSDYDGKFHYCRAVYRQNPRGDGGSWLTDYPLADIDLSIRVSELTKIPVAFDAPEPAASSDRPVDQ